MSTHELAVTPLLTLLIAAGAAPTPEAAPIVVPMTHVNRHVGVLVEIGGHGPYRFQVDTYAGIEVCIDDDLAEELGLERTGTTLNSDGSTTRRRDLVRVEELRLGEARFSDLTALVDDYDWVSASDGTPVRGLLGFPLFREMLVTFDYPGNRLLLEPGDLDPDGEHVMPFRRAGDVPDVVLTIDGRPLTFGLDTGSGSTLMLHTQDAERLPLHGELEHYATGRTVYSEFEIQGAFLDAPVEFAGHRFEPTFGSFVERKHGKRLIGYGLLRGFAVTFDQRRSLVRFTLPPPPEPATLTESQLARWVGEFEAEGQRLTIYARGSGLVLRRGDGPVVETRILAPDELGLVYLPQRLRLAEEDGERVLLWIEHPELPPRRMFEVR